MSLIRSTNASSAVAACALETFGFGVRYVSVDRRCDRFMTPVAGILHHLVIELGDLDRVGISAAGEIEGMPESVVCLHRIFPHNVVRSVAIVAYRHRVMAGLHSRVVLRLHQVAVRAGSRIVRQVGVSLGINKGVSRSPTATPKMMAARRLIAIERCTKDYRFEKQERNTPQHRSCKTAREGLGGYSGCCCSELAVYVRTLPGIVARSSRFFHDLHIKVDRQSLRRETLRIVASLIP